MDCTVADLELLVLNEINKDLRFDNAERPLDDGILSIVHYSMNCRNLHSVFDTSISKNLLNLEIDNMSYEFNIKQMEKCISERTYEFLNSAPHDGEKGFRHLALLFLAVANLKVFVEHNWVGPPLQSSLIWPNSIDMMKKSDDYLRPLMMVDGEDVSVLTSNLIHFFIARHLLTYFKDELFVHCKTSKFWLVRCLWIQQFLYDERLPTLKNTVMQLIQDDEKSNSLFMDHKYNLESFIQFHLESCHISYFYYEPKIAKHHISLIKENSGLTADLTGVLGKRTRFQQSSLPQLVLQVKRSDKCPAEVTSREEGLALPKNLSLDDDAVLDKMQLEDPEAVRPPKLSQLEQCFIMGMCYHHRRGREGQGSIIKEETMAYLNCVLSQPQSWCVETMALFTRCKWEYEGIRYLQRSITQLEELSNQYRKPSKAYANRLSCLFSSILPPHWIIERELGEMLDNMNLTNSALEVFERLQMWDDVIRCHAALNNRDKAEALIRQQLSVKETPLLWCYLGDVTKDESCYHKAWELSGHRFARAQRSLAFCYVGKREFEKALEYFEKSLEINPLQIGVWFSYGCASLSCGQYEKAAIGFRRTVNLNSDNFEAWNNLATAYISAKNKPRAFVSLQEALKCDYENWKVWENYLVVSVDIGQFEETIRAYHRLLDLKQKHNDVEVLSLLTKAVCENVKDATGQDSVRLKPKLLKLFGHVTSKVTNNADVWRLYAQVVGLVDNGHTLDEAGREKVLQYLQKSHRCSTTLTPNWEKDPEKATDVCKRTLSLGQAYNSYLSLCTNEEHKTQGISSAKLAINGVIVSVQRRKIDFPPGETLDALNKCLDDLEKCLKDILSLK